MLLSTRFCWALLQHVLDELDWFAICPAGQHGAWSKQRPLQVNLRHPEMAWEIPSFWLDSCIPSFAWKEKWGQNQPRSQGKALTNPGSASKKPGGYWILAEKNILPSKTISWTLEEISREIRSRNPWAFMMRTLGTWGLEDLSPWKVPMLSFPPKLWRLGSLRGKGNCDNMHIQCVCRVHPCGYEVVIVKKHGTCQSYLHIYIHNNYINIYVYIDTHITNIYIYVYIYLKYFYASIFGCRVCWAHLSQECLAHHRSSPPRPKPWQYSECRQNQTWFYKDTQT